MKFHAARLFAFVVAATVASGSGCASRANPRLTEARRVPADDNNPTETIAFSYDDGGRVEEVEATRAEETRTWKLTWKGSELSEVEVTSSDGQGSIKDTVAFTWESGRLSKSEVDGDSNGDTSYDYDDKGRIDSTESEIDGATTKTSFDYDDDGRTTTFESETTQGADLSRTSIEIDYSGDGTIDDMTLTSGTLSFVFSYDYDEDTGQLTDVENVSQQNLIEVTTRFSLDYDEDTGLLTDVEQTGAAGGVEAKVADYEYEYDDGNANTLDVTPNWDFGFFTMFDLRGQVQRTPLDNVAQVPRVSFTSW